MIFMLRKTFLVTAALSTVFAAQSAFAVATPGVSFSESPLLMKAAPHLPKNKTLTVTNTSGAAITFGTTTYNGANSGDFAALTDSCGNHTIQPAKTCHVKIQFSPDQLEAIGTVDTANINLSDTTNGQVDTDQINGTVIKDSGLTVVANGLLLTIKNPTAASRGMDYSTYGSASINNAQSTCVDTIFPHSKCTLQVYNNGNGGPGSADIEIFGPEENWDFQF
jgi:hypothetical protein